MDDKRSSRQFGLIDSSSYIIRSCKDCSKGQADLLRSHPLGEDIQAREAEPTKLKSTNKRPMSALLRKTYVSVEHQATDLRSANPIRGSLEPYCHVKLDSIQKLKDSTRKLLRLLDDIQLKTYSKDLPPLSTNNDEFESSTAICDKKSSIISEIADPALKNLEAHTQELNTIYIEDDYDDCSIFKKLTRKCICLNQQEYNDFVIHFNENTKYFTSTAGEIIKNLRILKKFMYMGGSYTKNALIFLNEGLEKSSYAERVEITHGCSHSDVCNVFEDHSIVVLCISWPCKFPYYGDNETQNLAASLLYKLAQLEEGRRYLKYTTKITNDIKRALRKDGSKLDIDTTETLEAALNLIHPPMTHNATFRYSPKNDEGFVTETINALQQLRKEMTLDEVFKHLESLANYSCKGKGKTDLTFQLPTLLLVFKEMLKEYDNSEINIIITNILNNIILKNTLKQKCSDEPKAMTVADTATEPVRMKNEVIQMPPKHCDTKKANKSKLNLGSKFRQPPKHKVAELVNPPVNLNNSRKFCKSLAEFANSTNPNGTKKFSKSYGVDVIVVPFDE